MGEALCCGTNRIHNFTLFVFNHLLSPCHLQTTRAINWANIILAASNISAMYLQCIFSNEFVKRKCLCCSKLIMHWELGHVYQTTISHAKLPWCKILMLLCGIDSNPGQRMSLYIAPSQVCQFHETRIQGDPWTKKPVAKHYRDSSMIWHFTPGSISLFFKIAKRLATHWASTKLWTFAEIFFC
jgi:hypothetical protein